jgi:hypothetical protein
MIQRTIFVILLVVLVGPGLSGQTARPDQGTPPPLKIISPAERRQLDSTKDEKARVKLTIELAENHLMNVESHVAQQQYEVAIAEAGLYCALIDDVFSFLKALQRDNDKKRDLYKRLELTLRSHGTRLSTVRRNTPAEYAVWLKDIEDVTRKGRTEALNSFYGHTVLREVPKSAETKDLKKAPDKN